MLRKFDVSKQMETECSFRRANYVPPNNSQFPAAILPFGYDGEPKLGVCMSCGTGLLTNKAVDLMLNGPIFD